LDWFSNYSKEEIPPEHLWEDVEGLDLWFGRVSEDRETQSEGTGVPDNFDADDEALGDNELARALRG
jgi:hypothetical protein